MTTMTEAMTSTAGKYAIMFTLSQFSCCNRFLGPRMIYTSGVVTDLTREETLEELQDNKLTVVCEKVRTYPLVRARDPHVLST